MDDVTVVDVQLAEEGVVEVPPYLSVAVAVELVNARDQVQCVSQHACPEGELLCGQCQSGFDSGPIDLDLVEPCADLGDRQRAVGGEVNQTRFLLVEFVELSGEGRVCLAGASLGVGQGGVELGIDLPGKILAELERGVVIHDRLLDSRDGEVWQVAEAVLSCSAEIVAIAGTAPFGFRVDQPRGPPVAMASSAEQQSFEVMPEDAVTVAATAAGIQDLLDAVEQVLADDWLVSAGVDVALVDDEAGVVRVAQHPVKLRLGHWPARRPSCRRLAREPAVRHRGGQPVDGVVACGVEFPSFAAPVEPVWNRG